MSNAPRQPPPKKEVALALLEESSMFIHLDPRRPDVVVPKWFMGQPQLVLQVGLNMAIPIPDLRVEDDGITCTLSFNRSPFWCKIPWSAIYALVGEDGRGGVWPDDVPPEIQLQQQRSPAQQKPAPGKRPRPKLSAVGGQGQQPRGAAPAKSEGEEDEKRAAPVRRGPVAVPAPAEEPKPAREEASEGDEGTTAAEPTPAAPAAGGKKPKREIPPYLRVIK